MPLTAGTWYDLRVGTGSEGPAGLIRRAELAVYRYGESSSRGFGSLSKGDSQFESQRQISPALVRGLSIDEIPRHSSSWRNIWPQRPEQTRDHLVTTAPSLL